MPCRYKSLSTASDCGIITRKKQKGGVAMKLKKAFWILLMLVAAVALVFVIESRTSLSSEIVFGGADSVFVSSDNLKKPLDDYESRIETEEKYSDLDFPNIDIEDWNYILINSSHVVKDNTPEVAQVGDSGISFDKRAINQLVGLVQAARKAGFDPYLACGYVSYTEATQQLNEEAAKLTAGGRLSFDDAMKIATKNSEIPGTSDHQTALGVDITDKQYDDYDYSKMNARFFEWLDENCAEYGFIKRYPSDKSGITGLDQPWHYRYVGAVAAKFIMENNMCLEEFADHYEYQK